MPCTRRLSMLIAGAASPLRRMPNFGGYPCLLKKVVRKGWTETLGRANAPIDTGSEQINRLSQGRLQTAPVTIDGSWPPEDREARVLQQPPLSFAYLSRSSAST
jgi:hypothetical protein